MSEAGNEHTLIDFMWLHTNLGGNVALVQTLLNMFIEMLDKQEAELDSAFDAADLAPLQKKLHTLKGTSATVGAGVVREMALELETACKENRPGDVRTGLPPFLETCAKTKEAILRFFADGMPFPA